MTNYNKLRNLGIDLKRTSGQQKVKCPKCSSGRKHKNDLCLSVNTDDGIYNCHNPGCDFKGTVVDYAPKKEYTKPVFTNNTSLSEKLVAWFKSRGISQKTIIEMKTTEGMEWMPQNQKKMNTVQFNYFEDGELVNTKFRTGNKWFKMVAGAKLIFFNIDSIKGQKEAVIVEGEIDVYSYVEADVKNVISVPNGASKGSQKLEYIDNCYEDLKGCEKIYIGTDNDEAGIALRDELVRRLGDERCYIIDYKDCKDGNEYLQKYGALELAQTIKDAKAVPIEGIFTADQLTDQVDKLYNEGLPPGLKIYIKEFDEHISFILGQLTLITGIPGHGKGEILDMIIERLAVIWDLRFGIFSPENFLVELHISKIAEKLTGKSFSKYRKMSNEEKNQALDFIKDHFYWIKPKDESYSLDVILDRALVLVRKYGINGLVIDPWNTIENQCPHGMPIDQYINNQLAKLVNFGRRYNVLLFLVAHPTKLKKEKGKYPSPTLYDVSGAAHFANRTDNGIAIFRDFEKKRIVVSILKIKFKHLGKVGQIECIYDYPSGRLDPADGMPDDKNHLIDKPTDPALIEEKEVQENLFTEEDLESDIPF